jgi:hypothetical protein
MSSLSSLNLKQRFLGITAGFVVLTALSSQAFFTRQARADLELRLGEKAAFINKTYALSIATALVQKDDILLLQVINNLEEDPEISSVLVVDQRGSVRYHADTEKLGAKIEDTWVQKVLETGEGSMMAYSNEAGKALALVTPLKVPGLNQPLGVVRIDLTYRRISEALKSSRTRFGWVVFGSIGTCCALMFVFLSRWILEPLGALQNAIGAVNPAVPEPTIPRMPEPIGGVSTALNELLGRFKNENQRQWMDQRQRADQERIWVDQLSRSLLPGSRILLVDKDNLLISDSENPTMKGAKRPHLLDLIKDSNFATLLTDAFQREGEVVRGPVTFDDQNCFATVLSVPAEQSVMVKTLIALSTTKEAV